MLSDRGNVTDYEINIKNSDGSIVPCSISAKIKFEANGLPSKIIGSMRDITKRKQTEKELIEAKNKAEESDRLKSAFLANMSHEVRTPLNSIIGFSELLADPDFGEEEKSEFIQHIISNGRSLLSVISDIMDISKIESGEIKIRKSLINAWRFVSNIIELFVQQAVEKELELKLTFDDHDKEAVIIADPDRLSQIFNNLMSNAIKFTDKGRIEIGYQMMDKMVEFYVKDSGIGIAAEYHDTIFERFRQVEAEKTRKYGGNGLGLAITKKLVELMGGKIWLKSESGKGSVFYFTIPGDDKLGKSIN
jgi:signal transduction histidine kinase